MPVRGKGFIAALLSLAVLLPGCAGDSALPSGGFSADAGSGTPGSASPYSDATKAEASVESGGFNPFAQRPDKLPGGRQVIKAPTIAQVMQTGTLKEMSFGRPDAPVTIIKYASLTCPYCRGFQRETYPKLKRAYIDTGKVRFIIREFPIGKASGAATIALRCAKPEKYLVLYGKFLEQQNKWVSQEVRLDAIYKVASQVGMTRQQFDACRENQAMIDGLKWIKDRGRSLGVIGTPNFFVQGKLIKRVLTMTEIRETVEPLLAAPATAAVGAPG